MTTVSEYAEDNKTLVSNIVKAMFKAGTPVTVGQELSEAQVKFLNTMKPWPAKVRSKQAVYSSRDADKFVVRLPDGLRERIQVLANAKHRSMNSQIVHWLEMCVSLEESSVNGFTEDDLKAFLDAAPADNIIVPMQRMNYTPAPGCPVRVKNDGGVWLVRNYVVRDDAVKAILETLTESNQPALLDVALDQLEPV